MLTENIRAIVWGQVWKNKSINEPIGCIQVSELKWRNKINGKDHYSL